MKQRDALRDVSQNKQVSIYWIWLREIVQRGPGLLPHIVYIQTTLNNYDVQRCISTLHELIVFKYSYSVPFIHAFQRAVAGYITWEVP